MFDSEGVNGHYYSEEHDFGEECGPSYKRTTPFRCNDLYYHTPLLRDHETYKIIHQTEKAILFEVTRGRFWVPKALMRRRLMVHKSFQRKYITCDNNVTINICITGTGKL